MKLTPPPAGPVLAVIGLLAGCVEPVPPLAPPLDPGDTADTGDTGDTGAAPTLAPPDSGDSTP